MTLTEKIARYREDFDLFETANEKLEYVFDLGKQHRPLPPEDRNNASYISGCASDAWLVATCADGILHLRGEGTSEMAKGMLTLLLDIFDARTPDEILAFDPAGLEALGVIDLLSPVRRQSLEAFVVKLYGYARMCKEAS